MHDYEWGNQAALLLPVAAEPPTQSPNHQPLHLFHHFNPNLHPSGNHFLDLQTPTACLETEQYRTNACGFSLTPGAMERTELNLGERTYTYFSSSLAEEGNELVKLDTALRRPIGNWDVVRGGGSGGGCAAARCLAEGCESDLKHAKHYHRRHKVCEFHSKAPTVVIHGLTKRFCQQCGRFHVLAEFDQGKRSCRKRLAIHNRRRRKHKPPNPNPNPNPNHNILTPTSTISPSVIAKSLATARSVSPTRMEFGCRPQEGVPVVPVVGSISSSSSRLSSSSLLPRVLDFRPFGQHVSVASSSHDNEKTH